MMTRGRSRLNPWLAAAVLLGTIVVGVPLGATIVVPAALRIPKAHPHPPGIPEPAALFSHRAHDSLGCYVCHPSVFPQAPFAFTHVDMAEGRACGACHNGKGAKAIASFACGACHVP